MKKLFKKLISFIFTVALLIGSYIGINEGMAFYTHNKIASAYFTTHEKFIYVDNREIEEDILEICDSVLESIPEHFAKLFKEKWVVVVSEAPPAITTQVNAMLTWNSNGLTFHNNKTIWVSSQNASLYKTTFAHEIGHFIAYELGGADYADGFDLIYQEYKDSYIQHDASDVSEYDASTANEFYAMLCKEYICAADYLAEHCPEGFEYMQKDMQKPLNSFFLSGYWNEFKAIAHNIGNQIAENVQYYKELYIE